MAWGSRTNATPLATAATDLHSRLMAFAARAGYRKPGSIAEGMTFRQWCEDLAAKGLKVDRKPFRLDDRPALAPIYDAIPSTRAEAAHQTLVIMKATQLGLTVWEVLADLYMALKWAPVNIGLFLPDQTTAGFKSEHRFMPIVRSSPLLYQHLAYRDEEGGTGKRKKVGEGNILTRQVADSLLMFLWTSGKVSTESRPMDVVSLDEVQGMTLDQIDKVRARTGDSEVDFTLLLSTANMPELDIDAWYRRGTQEVWHTECESCGAMTDLSDPAGIFPDQSIAYNTGQYPRHPQDEYLWCCPSCRQPIADPQRGRYIAANPQPQRGVRSFLLPRTISPRMTPRQAFDNFRFARTGDQKKSFYNRTLARPYIDPDQLLVTLSHCRAAVAAGQAAGLSWLDSYAGPSYMGIDQMGGWNAVIIKRRLPDGRQAVIHVEAVWGEEPFLRCDELMKQYGVAVCVVEQLPNVNSARAFANRHRGKVFLAGYSVLRDDFMVWGDDASVSDRRTAEADRTRYTVNLNQYKCMQVALQRVRDTLCLFPDPAKLEQEVFENGKPKRIPILEDWVFLHFTKTALVVEQNEQTRKPVAKVLKVGMDPHFSYANMLVDVAWARNFGTSTFIMPDAPAESGPTQAQTSAAAHARQTMPGLPQDVLSMMDTLPAGVCGRCSAFKDGRCQDRDFLVGAADPGCALFSARGTS